MAEYVRPLSMLSAVTAVSTVFELRRLLRPLRWSLTAWLQFAQTNSFDVTTIYLNAIIGRLDSPLDADE